MANKEKPKLLIVLIELAKHNIYTLKQLETFKQRRH